MTNLASGISSQNVLLPEDVIVLQEFITHAEQETLLRWASDMEPELRPNGRGRQYSKIETLSTVPEIYQTVRLRLQDVMNLGSRVVQEPQFGWYLSVIRSAGAIHEHIDNAPIGCRHLRCNLFLQLPAAGGMPIIKRQIIGVTERSLLAFFPNERRHASEAVAGDRDRIILSFGYLAPATFLLPEMDHGSPICINSVSDVALTADLASARA